MNYKDKTIMYVFGLKRGGNHPIISWLVKGYEASISNNILHLNNAFDPNEDPPKIIRKDTVEQVLNQSDGLVVSYEDVDLSNIKKTPSYFGFSDEDYNLLRVIIVRDPYNFIASRMKMLDDMDRAGVKNAIQSISLPEAVVLWKQYAKEALGLTNFLSNKQVVSFNDWFTKKPYRDQVMNDLLSIKNEDAGLQEVPGNGRGSSFDYRHFNGEADKMKVLDRWRYYQNDHTYINLLNDQELIRLARQLFGSLSISL